MSEKKPSITWVFDRDAARNPFIGISVKTLREAGHEVFLIDGADSPADDPNRVHPFSRAHWGRNFNAAKNFINTNTVVNFFDRHNYLKAEQKKLRKLKAQRGGARLFDINANHLRARILPAWISSTIHTFLWKGIRRLALLRRDTIDTWSPYLKGSASLARRAGDIIVVSRPTALLSAWIIARLKKKRLVYYPFELYGDQAADYSRAVRAWERWILRQGVDALITQNECRAKVYVERGHNGPVHIVHNYKPLHQTNKLSGKLHTALGISPDKKIVLYEGMMIPGRWLDRLAQASLYLPDDMVMVFLGPTKRWWDDEHDTFTAEPVARGKLIIAPPVPHDELLEFIADANAGIIIYDDSILNNYYCEPGKLSDYAFSEIPVIAPDFPTIGPIVRSLGVGACFREFTPEGMASSIIEVLSKPREDWRPALRAAASKLAWESQATTLLHAVTGNNAPANIMQPSLPASAANDSREVVDILFLVEHADRELDVACLIKAEIERAQPRLKVKVANFYTEAQKLIDTVAPRVIVTPFLYAIEDKVMRDYVASWSQSIFFNMAWEQILYGSQQTLKRPRDEFTRDRVRHLAWSEWFQDYLQSHGVASERVHWLGHPLYDLYDPDLRSFFPNRKEIASQFGLDPAKRWIFFPENFRWAFLTDKKFAQMSQQGVDLEDLEAQRTYCREALGAAAHWLSALAKKDEYEAILRPRPAVNTKQLQSFVEEHVGEVPRNLHLLKQLSVREWIFASDLTVSSISTSLIEAAVAGKPILRASPCEVPGTLWYDWCEHVPVVETEEEFVAAVSGKFDMSGTNAVRDWAAQSFKLGERPTLAIAHTLMRLVNQASRTVGLTPPRSEAPPWLHRTTGFTSLKLRHQLRTNYQPNYFFNYETHEKDLFGDAEVRARTRKWTKVLARAARLKAA